MPEIPNAPYQGESHKSSLSPSRITQWFGGISRQRLVNYSFMITFVILVLIAASASEVFFTPRNISNLFRQIVSNGLISLGMLVVILTGGIDLSVGSIVALTGIVTAGLTDSLSLPVAVVIGLLVGILAGALNGFLVAKLKLPAFIATLATLSAIRGLTYVYSEIPQTPNNPAFRSFLGGGFIGPVPIAVIIMLIIYPLVWFFINRTTSGRAIFAIGGNEEAVRLAGINVSRHIAWAYIISGLCSGIAGILLASRLGIAQPSVGVGYELAAIAAVVIGGGILGGGGGSVFGTFAGVLILGLINNLLNLFNVQSYYQQILSGAIIVFAVLARQKE